MSDPAPNAPKINLMLAGLAEVMAQPLPEPPPPPSAPPAVAPVAATPQTREEAYAQFRIDMRRAGFAVYELTEEMLGLPHEGPAVNVRDPGPAIEATSVLLVTHALAPGLYRLYPVLNPIEL